MMERTTITTVVFEHPFMLGTGEGPFPAGSYVVETEEELIPGLSFQAYRRIRTTMNVPIARGIHRALQALVIDPKELEKALQLDVASTRTTK
jgi:hypothetical protein